MPSFVDIGPPVVEEKIFEGFLPYIGMAAILAKRFQRRGSLNIIVIYMYIARVGADEPLGSNFLSRIH